MTAQDGGEARVVPAQAVEASPPLRDAPTADLYRRRHELSRLLPDDAARAAIDAINAEIAGRVQTRRRRKPTANDR